MPCACFRLRFLCWPADTVGKGYNLFRRPNRHTLSDDFLSELLHFGWVVEPQERAGVAGRQDTGRQATLHERRQLHQPESVGDLRTGASNPFRQFFVRTPEVVQELLVRSGLFKRIQLAAVQVLQKRITKQIHVLGGTDDRRNEIKPSLAAGTPTPFTHNKLIGMIGIAFGGRTNHNGLQDADLTDRVHQLGHVFFIEDAARLLAVGMNGINGQFSKARARNFQKRFT